MFQREIGITPSDDLASFRQLPSKVMDIGDFVFHCHILGHEDLGMMAIEQVNPASSELKIKDNKTPTLADKNPNSFRLPRVTERVISTGTGGGAME
jgi:hypothetical protein